ncbi:unnamed protein product, partial [Meganyctiphanes norvegica]
MASLKVVLGLCLVACGVVARPDKRPAGYGYQPPQPSYSAPEPSYSAPQPSYSAPQPSYSAPQPSYQEPEKEEGMPFDFAYAVEDQYKGVDFGHNSNSDGKVVTGEYRVALPDGRTQIVTYTADHYNGYQAQVTYEGEAQYPEVEAYQAPAQSYKQPEPKYEAPEPVYQPAPTYQPAPKYQPAPAPTYQKPEPTYGPPTPSYGQ